MARRPRSGSIDGDTGRWGTMAPTGQLTERRVRLDYPDDVDPMWTPAMPEFACAANAVSLMMPVIEPYFVRTIAEASADLDGPERTATETYLAQERAHHGQHQRFNRLLVTRYPNLRPVERALRATYGALERRSSQRFNLAVVAVSETMAYSAARWAEGHRRELFDRADPVVSTLFLWHLAEEVEHKASAHEVHRAVDDGGLWLRARMLMAMVVALSLVMAFVGLGTTVMLAAERRLHHPLAWLRLLRWSIGFAFELLGNLAMTLLPGHHPDDFIDPLWYEVWLKTLDAGEHTVAVWHTVPEPGNDLAPVPETDALNGRPATPTGTMCPMPAPNPPPSGRPPSSMAEPTTSPSGSMGQRSADGTAGGAAPGTA